MKTAASSCSISIANLPQRKREKIETDLRNSAEQETKITKTKKNQQQNLINKRTVLSRSTHSVQSTESFPYHLKSFAFGRFPGICSRKLLTHHLRNGATWPHRQNIWNPSYLKQGKERMRKIKFQENKKKLKSTIIRKWQLRAAQRMAGEGSTEGDQTCSKF